MSSIHTFNQSKGLEFRPDDYPAFPSGLPTADLETISLSKLEKGLDYEENRVFEICKTRGFFYLDISNSKADGMRAASEDIAGIAEQVFRLPLADKMALLEKSLARGSIASYKNAGRLATDAKGTPDTAEFWGIPKDDMLLAKPQIQWPSLILENHAMLRDYIITAHETGLLILSILSKKLNLPIDTLAKMHRLHELSGDHIRMTRGPARKSADLPEIQTPGHTDFGTITLLFNWLGGLQIWSESNRGNSGFSNVVDPADSQGQWLWIKPKRGHLIVNLGDAAVKFTNGLLCSGRHRVVPAPGEQGLWPRYSVVYFVRPEDNVVLKSLKSPGVIPPPMHEEDGEELTAKEWIFRQAMAMQTKH